MVIIYIYPKVENSLFKKYYILPMNIRKIMVRINGIERR